MGAFDSIKMGHRCREWSLGPSDVPAAPQRLFGTSIGGKRWIAIAAGGHRRRMVKEMSAVVLDGGPRWVVSTALGFFMGGLWWTFVYTTLFAVANYAIFVNTAYAPWTSATEAAGIMAYTILAAVLSMASVLGPWRLSDWRSLASGLAVELFLSFCVIVSAGNLHSFFGPSLADFPGLSPYADAGRWAAPALVWVFASGQREKAIEAVQNKLSGWWRFHPMVTNTLDIDSLWDDWSDDVKECANRVGGYGMLGFSASDLDTLSASPLTRKASEVIKNLRSSLRQDVGTVEPWIKQSSAFLAGYDSRLRLTEPMSNKPIIKLDDVGGLIRSVILGDHSKIDCYQEELMKSEKWKDYIIEPKDGDAKWIVAGALLADSDYRTYPQLALTHGSRLAVSIAVLTAGTDPMARLRCYADSKVAGSSVQLLQSAISESVKALVSELARTANVSIAKDFPLGERGLAYATGTGAAKCLAYSPDELSAASHHEETIVISDDTLSSTLDPVTRFERLWGGSAKVDKRVDISDMVPLMTSPSAAVDSACLGWIMHLGFTLAILTLYLLGASSKAIVVVLLVAIPTKDKRVSVHSSNHFYMIYIRFVLNYARFISRWASLSQRGRATVKKAQNSREIAFLFVNVLPVFACYVFDGPKWWVAYIPCILANIPGLLNTVLCGWESAFKYEWWSWHVPNRWFSGRGYLEVVALRNRLGRNVLLVNDNSFAMQVEKVEPSRGLVPKNVRFAVVGGGRWAPR